MRLLPFIFAAGLLLFSANSSYASKCDCGYQKCVDFVSGSEVVLKGISGIKKSTHPTRGEFSSIVLFVDEAVCLRGKIHTAGDGPQPVLFVFPNTTHIQLVLHGKEEIKKFAKANKGKRFEVTGSIFDAHSAWHTTPLVLDVKSFQNIPFN